jgi:hypothetical protein
MCDDLLKRLYTNLGGMLLKSNTPKKPSGLTRIP